MNGRQAVNPFVPGRGHIPPYLAGREAEQGKLLDLFAYLRIGRGAPRDAVLSGPRGNGKTALLRWLRREIEASGTDVDVVWLTPARSRISTGWRPVWCRLHGLRRYGRTPCRSPPASDDSAVELGGRSRSLTLLLTARCARRPLVLLLDEAHTLESEVGRALLNASQAVSSEAPFLLVMAGTPGLQPHLDTMSATFWSRAEKLGIGRLDEEAAALALVRPMAEQTPAIVFDEGDAGARGRRESTLSLLSAAMGCRLVGGGPIAGGDPYRPISRGGCGVGVRPSKNCVLRRSARGAGAAGAARGRGGHGRSVRRPCRRCTAAS